MGLLGIPEAVAFLTSKYVSFYYPKHFLLIFQKNFTKKYLFSNIFCAVMYAKILYFNRYRQEILWAKSI